MPLSHYFQRVAANILPLSGETSDVQRALQEWEYSGEMYDLGIPSADCELCDQPDIRYQFEIENTLNHASLLIGSECITRFDIRVVDSEGHALVGAAAARRVAADRGKLIAAARLRDVVRALMELGQVDATFGAGRVQSFLEYYLEHRGFTPNQLATMLWRLDRHGIRYQKSHLKMKMRRGREQSQIESMEDHKYAALLPCLTRAQVIRCHQLRGEWQDEGV